MSVDTRSKIVIAGAGSVGCYVGGSLALAGRDVTLMMRDRLAGPAQEFGLSIANLDARARRVAPKLLHIETDASMALSGADIVLVTVKGSDTGDVAKLVARHAPNAVVVSLQNGVGNVEVLSKAIPKAEAIVPGMVPSNMVLTVEEGRPLQISRATSGTLLVGDAVPGLASLLDVPGLPAGEHADMTGVLWSKLVLNMNNALNALSGLPLVEELGDPAWRRLLARQMDEALGAISAAGISLAPIEGVHPKLIPHALRLPTPVFRLVARKMLAIAPDARSSMSQDFEQGRKTEIDYLQGAVIDLAKAHGRTAPRCEKVVSLVKAREKSGNGKPLAPSDIKV